MSGVASALAVRPQPSPGHRQKTTRNDGSDEGRYGFAFTEKDEKEAERCKAGSPVREAAGGENPKRHSRQCITTGVS